MPEKSTKPKIIFLIIVVVIIAILVVVFLRAGINSSVDREPASSFQGWPPKDNYECNSDLDCVSLYCLNMGNLAAHKNALKYLDEFKGKFCDPVISDENVSCFMTSGFEDSPYYKKCVIS